MISAQRYREIHAALSVRSDVENVVTPDDMQNLMTYNPKTGLFAWKARDPELGAAIKKWNGRWAGKPALTADDGTGYLRGSILERNIRAHRAAFAIFYGRWPVGEIDHIDRNPTNNRIENLRECSREQNVRNRASASGSTSRFSGVSFNRKSGRWTATIRCNGKTTVIGHFASEQQAIAARLSAAPEYFGEFAPKDGGLVQLPDQIWAVSDRRYSYGYWEDSPHPDETPYLRLDGPTLTAVREALRWTAEKDDAGDMMYRRDGPCAEKARAALAMLEGK